MDGLASVLAFVQEEKVAADSVTVATPPQAEADTAATTEPQQRQTVPTNRRSPIPAPHAPMPGLPETVDEEDDGTPPPPFHQVTITVDQGTGPVRAEAPDIERLRQHRESAERQEAAQDEAERQASDQQKRKHHKPEPQSGRAETPTHVDDREPREELVQAEPDDAGDEAGNEATQIDEAPLPADAQEPESAESATSTDAVQGDAPNQDDTLDEPTSAIADVDSVDDVSAPAGEDADAPSIEELKRAQQEALEEELRRLQTTQKEVDSERTHLQTRSEDAQAAINVGRRRLRQLTFPEPEELDETKQRLNALENERDRLQLELLNARARRDQDIRATEARRAARESELRTAIEQTQAELTELATAESKFGSDAPAEDLSELETHLEALTAQVSYAQGEIRRRREAIQAATESREKSRQLKELIAKGGDELARLQTVLSELVIPPDSNDEVSELDGQLQRQAEELQEVQAQFEEVEARRSRETASIEQQPDETCDQVAEGQQLADEAAGTLERAQDSESEPPGGDLDGLTRRPDFVLPQSSSPQLRFEPEVEPEGPTNPEQPETEPDDEDNEPPDDLYPQPTTTRLSRPRRSRQRSTTRRRMVLLTLGLSCLFFAYAAIAASFGERLVSLLRTNGVKPNAFPDLITQSRFWVAGALLLGHLICGARPKRVDAKMEWRAGVATGLAAVGITLWYWNAPPGWFWPVITVVGLLHAYFLVSYLAELCAFAQFAKAERYCDAMIASTAIAGVLFLGIGISLMLDITAGMHYFALAIASILLVGVTLLIPRIAIEIAGAVRKGRWKRS